MSTMTDVFGECISSYSRADAIADGILIEPDEKLCREAGIIWPVAISAGLWEYIEPDFLLEMPGQSVTGRLWDVLYLTYISIKYCPHDSDLIQFPMRFQMKNRMETITIWARAGPGDDGEPVLTIMRPEDD